MEQKPKCHQNQLRSNLNPPGPIQNQGVEPPPDLKKNSFFFTQHCLATWLEHPTWVFILIVTVDIQVIVNVLELKLKIHGTDRNREQNFHSTTVVYELMNSSNKIEANTIKPNGDRQKYCQLKKL